MPLDIRDFFKAKGSSKQPNKPSSSSAAAADKSNKKSKASTKSKSLSSHKASTPTTKRPSKRSSTRTKHVLSPIHEEGSADVDAASAKVRPAKRILLEEDNSDTDATTEADWKVKSTNAIKDDDDDDDDDEKPAAQAASLHVNKSNTTNNKKKATLEIKPKDLKEVSTEDYFAAARSQPTAKRTSTRNTKPKGSYVDKDDDNDDDDGDDDDDDNELEKKDDSKWTKSPSSKRRKGDDDFEDNDDLHDEDLDEDFDPHVVDVVDKKSKRTSPKASKSPPIKPTRKPSPYKKQKMEQEEDNDEHAPLTRGTNKRSAAETKLPPSHDTPSSTKKHKSNTTSTRNKKTPTKKEKEPLLEPSLELDEFDVDKAVPECMTGLIFVFSGVLDDGFSKDDAKDFVKTLGAKVTDSVSGRTSYLVVGELLDDGRPYHLGKKYMSAQGLQSCKIVMGKKQLFGLAKIYSDKARSCLQPDEQLQNDNKPPSAITTSSSTNTSQVVKNPAIVNPYAKKGAVVNPYAKKDSNSTNPYATAKKDSNSNNPYLKQTPAPKQERSPIRKKPSTNDLWVDIYAPTSTRDILGNKDCVTKLTTWLAKWESRFNNDKAVGKAFSGPQGPWKAALLSGPPGIGKTTTATLVAREAGRDVLEFNASDVRSKKAMQQSGDITGSKSIEGFFQSYRKGSGATANENGNSVHYQKRCIIMDEVDGMGGGDHGGLAELIQMIKNSRVPIICICNDRQSQKIKSLLPYCFDLKFKRPQKGQIAKAVIKIAETEGMSVQANAVEQMAESCGNDIRQVINCLQMWASDNTGTDGNVLTYKGLKERQKAINKDEILRISLFDASRQILEGRKGLNQADQEAERSHFLKRNDAFFVDYSFTGLIVQQNYLKVLNPQFLEAKRKNDAHKALELLERTHSAAQTMSDYTLVENKIRGGSDMNWSLLPFSGLLVVKTGFHAAGPTGASYPGFPEFTTWLGRNSSKGKKQRILQELHHHMNYRISGGQQEVRLSYVPFLRQRFLTQLKDSKDTNRNTVAISLMDDYGLDRDDVFENLDEFNMNPKGGKIDDLDSKAKAAFTREYNQGSHKSQALVVEQGAPTKTKRRTASSSAELEDPDAINDDAVEEDSDDDEEEDLEKLKAAFIKKGRRGKKPNGATTASKRKNSQKK